MVIDDKIILEAMLEKIGVIDTENILVRDLVNIIQNNTLGEKVSTALAQKKQGHFDKAIVTLSEVNRDQVLSIRRIQSIIDDINGVINTKIVFEKYQQSYPFKIGLRNGGNVLDLLERVNSECVFSLEEFINKLHANEETLGTMQQELTFYEYRIKGEIPNNEIIELKNRIDGVKKIAFIIKVYLFDCISSVILREYSKISISNKISLIKNIYLVLSSSIKTLDAKFVNIE